MSALYLTKKEGGKYKVGRHKKGGGAKRLPFPPEKKKIDG